MSGTMSLQKEQKENTSAGMGGRHTATTRFQGGGFNFFSLLSPQVEFFSLRLAVPAVPGEYRPRLLFTAQALASVLEHAQRKAGVRHAELPTGGGLEDTEPSAPAADRRRRARFGGWLSGTVSGRPACVCVCVCVCSLTHSRRPACEQSPRDDQRRSIQAPPCQISPHAPARPGSACRNDAGMRVGVVSTPAAPLRTLRVAAAYLVRGRGSGRVRESRGARRARGKVGLYFITGIKETQNGTRAAPTRARITSTLTQHA